MSFSKWQIVRVAFQSFYLSVLRDFDNLSHAAKKYLTKA